MTDKDSNTKPGLRKIDGTDFKVWKIRVENILKAEKCRIAFNEDFDLDEEDKKETNEELNDKVKTVIM